MLYPQLYSAFENQNDTTVKNKPDLSLLKSAFISLSRLLSP